MRILHLIHSEGIYGAELILFYLAREMHRAGHEIIIGSIQDPGAAASAFEAFARSCGLTVVPIRIAPRPTPGVITSLLKIVRDIRPDVTHSHGYKADILLGVLPRSVRGAMVATAHGWTCPPRFSALWLYQLVDRLCLRQLDRVVVVAPHMLSIPAVRRLPVHQVTVISNGIPPLAERREDQSRRRVAALSPDLQQFLNAGRTLVAIGRLSEEKGFAVLLDAFAGAARSFPRYQLAIVGDGSERQALEMQVTRLSLRGRVMISGYVDCADRVLQYACGFVMSSFTEGLPLALLEAMQWNVPIIATAVGAIPDVLDQGAGGTLVLPRDVETLQNALERFMTDESALRAKAQAALAKAEQHYSSVRMAQDYERLYRDVAVAETSPSV